MIILKHFLLNVIGLTFITLYDLIQLLNVPLQPTGDTMLDIRLIVLTLLRSKIDVPNPSMKPIPSKKTK